MASFGLETVRGTVDTARADYVDNTHWIRQVRNAGRIRTDVHTVMAAIVRRATNNRTAAAPLALTESDLDATFAECKETAAFLFAEMPVVFARLLKSQLDVPIFFQLLDVLESIERGERDQNEASECVGKLLHRSFIGGEQDAASSSSSNTTLQIAKPTLTWAEHCASRNGSVMHRMQQTQRFKDDSKAKLRAAIGAKQLSRTGKKD